MTSAATPNPFQINVSDSQISLLKEKLNLVRFPNELENAKWGYGVPLKDLKELVEYWKSEFDWKKQEKSINERLPQYTVDIPIDGHGTLNMHFVHQKSMEEKAIPLLFVHGWPGSFLEVSKILPLLTSPTSESVPSFHVVAPSLPGYGFSEGSKKKGFGLSQYAEACHKVMLALGYEQYGECQYIPISGVRKPEANAAQNQVSQGGDWGYFVTRRICQLYGDKHCKASLANMAHALPPQLFENPLRYLKHLISPYTSSEKAGLERTEWFRTKGIGYAFEQSTQPQTLAYSLTDSPSGLLAWIYEKLINWTDGYPWSHDEVLTWVSLYWFSRDGPGASIRIYYETKSETNTELNPKRLKAPSSVLVGHSVFPKDIFVLPKSWLESYAKIVFYNVHSSGGHFAAHEKPVELAEDLQAMFGKKGPAFQVVNGRSGYSAL